MLFATLSPDVSPHWLQRLGLVSAPDGTALRSAELSLRGGIPWWGAAMALALAGALAFYLYAHENARLGVARRALLAVLRTALVALVLMLLLRPVLLAEFAGQRPRAVVLLIDTSQSMSQSDRRVTDPDRLRVAIARGLVSPATSIANPGDLKSLQITDTPRIDLVRAALGNERLDLLPKFARKGPVQTYLFDRRLSSVAEGEDLAGSLKADGSQTALADSLHDMLTRMAGEPPAAVVVASDARDNVSRRTLDEVARAYRDQDVPLHFWGVGSTEAGLLQLKEVKAPAAVFVDEKPDVQDDLVEVPIRYRVRGFKSGTLVLTAKLGEQTMTERIPLREGNNLTHTLRIRPAKGKEGERPLSVSLALEGTVGVGDESRKMVQVRSSRVKVLYVENAPRREYRFIQPVLDRDRRVLSRIYLVEGDPRLAESPPNPESGAMFLDRFPPNFPDVDMRDPDKRPYDLLILGDVPYKALGEAGGRAVQQFVKEGGGLVVLAGRSHAPAEFVATALDEVLPVQISRQEFPPDEMARATPFRPALTYDGEQSPMLALDDRQEESLKLWKEDLWKNTPGFWWHYPVTDLRPGASALVVHPEKKTGRKTDLKPMPVVATHYYGKGEVLFLGTDETWRWRDSTADRLTARFWGQIVARLGLPHLLGNARRTQLDVERGGAVFGQPGTVKARLLDSRYEPVTRQTVKATLVNLDARNEAARSRQVVLRRVPGQPGEYRGSLPNDAPGRHELRLSAGDGLEGAVLPYSVDLPPRHELEESGLAEELLRGAAATSGGGFYREEDLHRLPDAVEAKPFAFTQRQEVLLWNPLALVAFVLLITAEWVLRKFSNLS